MAERKLEELERQVLYEATCRVIREATAKNGRDTERDLFDRPGYYRRVLDSRTVGQPCPRCGTAIEKISFLGGASYFCPSCQVKLRRRPKRRKAKAKVKPRG